MSDKSSGGYFSLKGEGEFGVEAFSAFIVSWSLGYMKNSLTHAEQCGLVTVLMDKKLPSKPFSACLISYHASLYVAMLMEYSEFPEARFEEMKQAIITELYKIKDAKGASIYSEKEGQLIANLMQEYTTVISENFAEDVNAAPTGPGECVMETVKELYGLDDSSLELEARARFSISLNASVSSVYTVLVKESECQWRVLH
ncbi:MAG: hypothetical protein ACSHXZ_01990 [Gammaproteobacteria bacterium]